MKILTLARAVKLKQSCQGSQGSQLSMSEFFVTFSLTLQYFDIYYHKIHTSMSVQIVLLHSGITNVEDGWLQLLFTATNCFGGEYDLNQLCRQIVHQND